MTTYFSSVDFMSPRYAVCFELRKQLLRDPLGMEFHKNDIRHEWKFKHLALYNYYDDSLLGTAMVKDVIKGGIVYGHIKQVCTLPTLHGQGYGKILMHELENYLSRMGYEHVFLHTRATVADFYSQCNYRIVGKPFYEVEIEHYYMEKKLS